MREFVVLEERFRCILAIAAAGQPKLGRQGRQVNFIYASGPQGRGFWAGTGTLWNIVYRICSVLPPRMFETPVVFLVKQYGDSRTATSQLVAQLVSLSLSRTCSSNPGPSHCRESRCVQGLQVRRVKQRTLSRRPAPVAVPGPVPPLAVGVAESCCILRRVEHGALRSLSTRS
jgi:hypothetical protein